MRLSLTRANSSGLIVYAGLIVVTGVFAILLWDDGFMTVDNFANILRQTAMVSIMAFGMTFALSAGEIDLSIGQVVALSSLVAAVLLRETSILLAIPGALGVGLVVGMVNGLLTTRLRVPSFLITLGMAGIVGGLARLITDLQAVPITDDFYTFWFGSGEIGQVPMLLIWTLGLLALSHVLYRKSTFGRKVLATGGNRIAARYSGINTDRTRIGALVMCSMMAALAGILYAGRLHGARHTIGENDLLTVIAAAVIGGTSMMGGRGSIVGALMGSLVMGILNNGLILMHLSVSEQMIARGTIIVIAVALSLRESKDA